MQGGAVGVGGGRDPREKETRRRGRGLERSSRAKLLFYFKRKKNLTIPSPVSYM